MPLFIWKRSYEIGIVEVDRQHRQLVGLINELYEAMKVGHGYELVSRLIDQLLAYAAEHLDDEEGFMRASSYPYLEAHVREHAEFRDRLAEMERGRCEGVMLPCTEMLDFLCGWLRVHILESDKDFGCFIKRQNLAQSGRPGTTVA